MLRMFGSSMPLVLERLSQHGHLVKKLVIRAVSSKPQVTFREQLKRTVACLSACDNLKTLELRISHASDTHSRESLATVFETLAKRASKLEHLRLVPSWDTLDWLEQFEDVLSATTCLKALYIKESGFKKLQIDNLGDHHHQLHARRIPQFPPLPLLTTLSVPTANFITTGTFDKTYACKELALAYVRAGDLAHVAKCVGHSIQRLEISSLPPSLHEDPPPAFAALRYLKAYDNVNVYLPGLFDPATPLETLEIDEMDNKVFAGVQEFYKQQPRKTLTRIKIFQPQTPQRDVSWMDPGLGPGPETEELEEERRLEIASHRVLERCLAWADDRGITIEAKWYKPDWSASGASAILA